MHCHSDRHVSGLSPLYCSVRFGCLRSLVERGLLAIAEQQILTNKVQRDALADNLNVMAAADNYTASEATQWGGSAATIAGYSQ
jgi:hypothetical protein